VPDRFSGPSPRSPLCGFSIFLVCKRRLYSTAGLLFGTTPAPDIVGLFRFNLELSGGGGCGHRCIRA
jgi:hypothetical protein